MGPLSCLTQVILGTAGKHFHLVGKVLVQNLPQGQDLGLLLIVHQGQHNDTEATLQRGLLKQSVQHYLGISILFQLNYDTHTVTVSLVPQIADTLQPLILYLIGNIADHLPFIYLIRQLSNNNTDAVFIKFFKFRPGANNHLAAAGGVSRTNTAATHNDTAGGEIRAGDMLHQIRHSHFRIIQHTDASIDHFRQVMGRNIGSHANGNTGRTVYQQIGETAGQNTGFFPGFVKVRIPVYCIPVNIPEHFVGHFGKPGFGITVSCRGVAIHRTEVTVAVHQHITHREILGKTHHSIIHRGIAVGVILT